ncbi:MAG: DUF924 family protein [Sphingorhabdus sp.]
MTAWVHDILHFWFDHVGPERWYGSGPEIDAEIRDRFEPLWQSLRHEPAIFFVSAPEDALAAVILFDQFPRNIFRHEAQSFATDPLALAISKLAVGAGFHGQLNAQEQQFLYMPFMHSENIADQEMSVELFDALNEAKALQFAIMHRDIVKRFGRFPHRNEVLGRETLPEEFDAITEGENW